MDASMINYAVATLGHVLPMNGIPHTTEDWAKLIEQTYDQSNPRTADVLRHIRACPAGTTITRMHGGHKTVLELPEQDVTLH